MDHDIAQAEGLGVKFEFGKNVNAADLDGFDAVFIGTGLWGTKVPDIEGKDLEGVWAAADFLKEARTKGEAFDPGKRVVVVGGGDVTVDCAVTAKLLGAEDVKIVYRRTLEEAPGNMTEFQYALELGIGITTGMAPMAVKGDGKAETAVFKGFRDDAAQMRISADTIVFATGQGPEDMTKIAPVRLTEKGTIEAAEDGTTSADRYFAAGDIVNGGKTVVEAVAAGKAAGASMIAYLEKKGVK